jgi:hypothetical protein
MVPRSLQQALLAQYVPGQERRKDPTAAYLLAAERCITAVAVKEGLIGTGEAADRVRAMSERLGLSQASLPF